MAYVTAGDSAIDSACLVEKLERLFGVDKILAAWGGMVNASFLADGLIDEISLLFAHMNSTT